MLARIWSGVWWAINLLLAKRGNTIRVELSKFFQAILSFCVRGACILHMYYPSSLLYCVTFCRCLAPTRVCPPTQHVPIFAQTR